MITFCLTEKVQTLKLRRVISTRFLISVARLVKGGGMALDKAIAACTVGWTSDELTRAGVASC